MLAAVRETVPAPFLIIAPEPEMTPESVTLEFPEKEIVPLLVIERPRGPTLAVL